jgi:GH18 family chitinase
MRSQFFTSLVFVGLATASPAIHQKRGGSTPSHASSSPPYVPPTPLPKSFWPGHKVIGYYAGEVAQYMEPEAVPWGLLTHVCFAFGTIGTDYAINITGSETIMGELFTLAKARNVERVLSVGGWGYGSSEYSAMVSSAESRKEFIQSLKKLIQLYPITGLDIAWEYPARASAPSVPFATTDVPNFLLLLQELRQTFGKKITLSAAVAGLTPFDKDVSPFAVDLDWVGLMEWDFAVGGTVGKTTSNSPLYGSVSSESGTAAWYTAGIPTDKMILGVPTYGRSFTLTDVLFRLFSFLDLLTSSPILP